MSTTILIGDVRTRLAELPDKSVQCCVTSPPYFGLRDYGTAEWSGGDPACNHKQGRPGSNRADGIVDTVSHRNRDGVGTFGGDCRRCGAVRIDQQIGLEPTLAGYIETMVSVFREVRRVLRDDGTLWLNCGDSYNAFNGNRVQSNSIQGEHEQRPKLASGAGLSEKSLKPKDLMMVPARIAIALQDDGWYLRSDIIWHKRAPMPESVTDRPTSAHEHIFLLTKSPRYYYDADSVREEWADDRNGSPGGHRGRVRDVGGRTDGFTVPPLDWVAPEGRTGANIRNVWTLSPEPYPDAHFATFPTEIPRRCIKAGTKAGDTVLDIFGGSGTTALVAEQLGRDCILIELNPEYAKLADRRIRGDAPLFNQVSVTP